MASIAWPCCCKAPTRTDPKTFPSDPHVMARLPGCAQKSIPHTPAGPREQPTLNGLTLASGYADHFEPIHRSTPAKQQDQSRHLQGRPYPTHQRPE